MVGRLKVKRSEFLLNLLKISMQFQSKSSTVILLARAHARVCVYMCVDKLIQKYVYGRVKDQGKSHILSLFFLIVTYS